MPDKPLAAERSRSILCGIEGDVTSDCHRARVRSPRQCRGGCVRVNSNVTEALAESRLHDGARRAVQRSAASGSPCQLLDRQVPEVPDRRAPRRRRATCRLVGGRPRRTPTSAIPVNDAKRRCTYVVVVGRIHAHFPADPRWYSGIVERCRMMRPPTNGTKDRTARQGNASPPKTSRKCPNNAPRCPKNALVSGGEASVIWNRPPHAASRPAARGEARPLRNAAPSRHLC